MVPVYFVHFIPDVAGIVPFPIKRALEQAENTIYLRDLRWCSLPFVWGLRCAAIPPSAIDESSEGTRLWAGDR